MLAKLAVDLAGAMVSALNAHRMQLMWARSFLLNAEYISAAVLKRPLSHEETKLIESMQAAFNPDDRLWAQCQSSRQHQTEYRRLIRALRGRFRVSAKARKDAALRAILESVPMPKRLN